MHYLLVQLYESDIDIAFQFHKGLDAVLTSSMKSTGHRIQLPPRRLVARIDYGRRDDKDVQFILLLVNGMVLCFYIIFIGGSVRIMYDAVWSVDSPKPSHYKPRKLTSCAQSSFTPNTHFSSSVYLTSSLNWHKHQDERNVHVSYDPRSKHATPASMAHRKKCSIAYLKKHSIAFKNE